MPQCSAVCCWVQNNTNWTFLDHRDVSMKLLQQGLKTLQRNVTIKYSGKLYKCATMQDVGIWNFTLISIDIVIHILVFVVSCSATPHHCIYSTFLQCVSEFLVLNGAACDIHPVRFRYKHIVAVHRTSFILTRTRKWRHNLCSTKRVPAVCRICSVSNVFTYTGI